MDCTNTFIYMGLIAIATFFKWIQGFIRLRNASVTSWVFDPYHKFRNPRQGWKKMTKSSQTFDGVRSVPVGVMLGGAAVLYCTVLYCTVPGDLPECCPRLDWLWEHPSPHSHCHTDTTACQLFRIIPKNLHQFMIYCILFVSSIIHYASQRGIHT